MKLTCEADLIVLPYDPHYLNNRIGLPNKLFEAISCGVGVLAQRDLYGRDCSKRRNRNCLFDYTDSLQLRYRIEELIEDRRVLQLFREKAEKLHSENLDQKDGCPYLRLVEKLPQRKTVVSLLDL